MEGVRGTEQKQPKAKADPQKGEQPMTKENWNINIQNTAEEVTGLLGDTTVNQIFSRYGASSLEELSPLHYVEVFDELDFIANDLR